MKKMRDLSVLVIGLAATLPSIAGAQDLGPQPLAAPPGYAAPQPQYAPPPPDAPPPQAAPEGYAQPVSEPPVPQDPQQAAYQQQAYAQSQQQPPQAGAQGQQGYSQEQLDQLVAPIALYPDELVSQILMASTYPLEVVEAERWRQQPGNAQLQGPALQAALDQQPWDPSVKSLVPFPQVMSMMNNNLQWTEQLGDAFLNSQGQVMDTVQGMRQRAERAGNLRSTPQESVQQQQGDIVIQPTNPQVVYVPYYNPQVVYGAWPYPAYPPYYFAPPFGYADVGVGLFAFGVGIAVSPWFWGWNHWDWHAHSLYINQRGFASLNRGYGPRFAGNAWAHDPGHRHGVPYAGGAARARFGGAATAARANYRGYFNASANRGAAADSARAGGTENFARTNTARANTGASGARTGGNFAEANRSAGGNSIGANHATAGGSEARTFDNGTRSSASTQTHTAAAPNTAARSATQSHSATAFDSFSRGSDVRAQSSRGSSSRASMASFSGGASHGGGGGSGGHSSGGGGGGHSGGGGGGGRH